MAIKKMNISLINYSDENCLIFEGSITNETAPYLEKQIINTMRSHQSINIDLSKVIEIDRYGLHLIGFMKMIGGKAVTITSISPAIESAINAHQPVALQLSAQSVFG